MFEEKREWDSVRKRNLRISITKGLIENNWKSERVFSETELKNAFRFKMRDLEYYAKDFFRITEKKYVLTEEEKKYIDKILEVNKVATMVLKDADARFIVEFGSFHDVYENDDYGNFSYERYREIQKNVAEILPVLHWGHLPIFNKYLLFNREIDPEQHILEFYDHYDCLKAMLAEIRGKGEKMQISSDDTLGKELVFEVYTRRWGHSDRYRMRRTIDGWECTNLAIGGECKKNGEGGLIDALNHDLVFFPEEGVKYAMEELWEASDEGEIGLEELQNRLQEVADWISHVEKAVGEKQPEWVKYY